MALKKEEIYRKVLHVFTGIVVPGLILYIPRYQPQFSWLPKWLTPAWYPAAIALAAAVGFTAVEQARFRIGFVQAFFYRISGAALRQEESAKMTGATYIVYSALICSIVFVNKPYISFMVLCAFIWGDAAAALVGQAIGRIKIGKKSLEGSCACFALCMALFCGGFSLAPHLLDAWRGTVPILVAVTASLCITVMELFPISLTKKFVINDNLTVPVLTGIIIELVYPALK
jgi:dolichol kinase